MTGTAGLNDTTIATSSTAHASTAHRHGDPTPPREAAPPVVRAGASRSDRTIARPHGKFECRPSFMLDQNGLQDYRRARRAPGSLAFPSVRASVRHDGRRLHECGIQDSDALVQGWGAAST